MTACQHLSWLVEEKPDHDGMVLERCRDCGVTRKSFGTWFALKDKGRISKNAMYSGSSFFDVSEPPEFRVNNVDFILTTKKEETPMPRTKRTPRPHGFWKLNQERIIQDIQTMGEREAKRKWKCPDTTWKAYLPIWSAAHVSTVINVGTVGMVGTPVRQEPLISATVGEVARVRMATQAGGSTGAPTPEVRCEHPCAELLMLRGYQMAIRELSSFMGIRFEGMGKVYGTDKD